VEALTLDTLRALARAQGLDLSDEDLGRLLPLVQAGRSLLAAIPPEALADLEPALQYRSV
jgi:hypothetical protein